MSTEEFEIALRSHLHSKFLSQLPPHVLKMRVIDFLQLAAISSAEKENICVETPKTATRRSTRQAPSSTVKRSLFPLTTPSKQHKLAVPATPSAPQTPHLTIKSSAPASVAKPVSHTPSKRHKPHHQLPAQTPKAQTIQRVASPATSTGIVQFQLQDGQVVDVDFSRSPKSALTEANLIGSEAISEVKAKIETYANQFMQYLKFFKKFKPN